MKREKIKKKGAKKREKIKEKKKRERKEPRKYLGIVVFVWG
jgi:hypothetical protein